MIAMAQHRSRRPQLVQTHPAVEDIAADQAELALQVERRMDLPRDDRRPDIGRMGGYRVDDMIGRRLALVIP